MPYANIRITKTGVTCAEPQKGRRHQGSTSEPSLIDGSLAKRRQTSRPRASSLALERMPSEVGTRTTGPHSVAS